MVKKYLFYLFFALACFFAPVAVQAEVPPDLFLLQDSVKIEQPVLGDALLAGSEVTVDAEVAQDLLIMGQGVTVASPVLGDVRALAGDIMLNGRIGGNATIMAGSVAVGKLGSIVGNLTVWSATLDIQGDVAGNVSFRGSSLTLGGRVNGDVETGEIKEIHWQPGARILGDLKYQATRPLNLPVDLVAGNIIYEPATSSALLPGAISWFWELVWFFAAIAFGLIMINFFARPIREINILMVQKPVKIVFLGLAAIIFLPIIGVLLMLTFIGIPLGLITLSAWLLLMYVAPLLVAIIYGKIFLYTFLKNRESVKNISAIWFLVIGLVILKIIFLVPWLGGLIEFITILWGLGGLVQYFRLKLQPISNVTP